MITEKNTEIDKIFKLHNEFLRNEFLKKLIHGYVKDGEILKQKFTEFGINALKNTFAVYVTQFKDEFDTQIRDIELISGRIEEIIYSHKTNDINIFCVSFEGRHFCIVNYDTKKSAYIKELMTDIFEKIKETLELCDSISSSIGASLNGKGAESIAYLAAEASAALEKAEFYGYSDIINFYSESGGEQKNPLYVYSLENENMLFSAVRLGDPEKVSEVTDKIFSENETNFSRQTGIGLTYAIINTILQANMLKFNETSEILFHNARMPDEISTFAETKQLIMNIFRSATETQNDTKGMTKTYLKVKEYVSRNFTDKQLNVSSIGDYLNISSVYVSKIFRENSGLRLNEYINGLRIDYAKKLLKEHNKMRIAEVGEKSGFETTRTFLNVFKKMAGISPTEYRDYVK